MGLVLIRLSENKIILLLFMIAYLRVHICYKYYFGHKKHLNCCEIRYILHKTKKVFRTINKHKQLFNVRFRAFKKKNYK